MLLPGVGSIIGSVVGGIAGSLAGDKLMLRSYQNLENRLEHIKKMKKTHPHLIYHVSDEDYKEALRILESSE